MFKNIYIYHTPVLPALFFTNTFYSAARILINLITTAVLRIIIKIRAQGGYLHSQGYACIYSRVCSHKMKFHIFSV